MLPEHKFSSSGIYLHLLLLNENEKPNLSANSFILIKSAPDPPALNSKGFLVE